jgi:hypothetical protein
MSIPKSKSRQGEKVERHSSHAFWQRRDYGEY